MSDVRHRMSSFPPLKTDTTFTVGFDEFVRVPSHRISLTVQAGRTPWLSCEVEGPRATIGTGVTNDLRLRDKRVSRCHCEIVATEGGYLLRDLGSKNGTFLKGIRIFEALLEPHSVISLGSCQVQFTSSVEWQAAVHSGAASFGELVGHSAAMSRTFGLMERVAPSKLTALILGETGTGKELAAMAIHSHSERAEQPFIVIDCAAVGAQFIEDKLFGHQRGAFTGASDARPGAFEEADGGTVFLDEIGELPLELQPKLLRVLERREVTRIGAHKPISVDVRVLAATHRDLEEMVGEGRFREDLFYRLAEIAIPLPSISERPEDLPLLARTILDRNGFGAVALSDEALAHLAKRSWPGNVRQLRNVLCRAATLAEGATVDAPLLSELEVVHSHRPTAAQVEGSEVLGEELNIKAATEAYRAAYVARVRARFGDDLEAAAEHVGVHPKSMQRLYRQYHCDGPEGDEPTNG